MRPSLPPRKFRQSNTPIQFLSLLTAFMLLFGPLVPASFAASRGVTEKNLRGPLALSRDAGSETRSNAATPSGLSAAAFAPQITATKTDAFPDPDGDGRAVPGDTITYTVTVTNNGADDAQGVVFTDTLDANTTSVAGSLMTTPLAVSDSYATTGNVRLSIPAPGLVNNDSDPDGNVLTASAGTLSAQGGNVSVASDGSFTYNPKPGFEGADSFTYTATDAQGNTDTATVTINVSGMIWFVQDGAAAGGDGRLTSPFNALTGAGSFDALAADEPSDNIFLYSGNYAGGLTLLGSQHLIGQGASSSLSQITGITQPVGSDPFPSTGGAHPVITSASNGVNLGMDNGLHGFAVGNTSGADIEGANFGTLTVRDVVLSGTGQALNLDTGNLDASFGTVDVDSRTATGLFLNGVTGTSAFGATSIPNIGAAGGYGIRVQNSSADISFASANISDANQTIAQLDADLNLIPDNDGDGDAIFLSNNTGSFIINGGVIANCGNDCIDVRDSSNLILSNVIIESPGLDVATGSTPGTGGHGLQAINLTGASYINGGSTITKFDKANRDGVRLINNVATASTMTVDNSTFSNTTSGSGNGILILGRNDADMALTVKNSMFTGLSGAAITHVAGDNTGSTATVNLTVQDSVFQNAASGGLNTVSARNLEGGKSSVVIKGNTFDNVARVASSNTGVITVNGDGTLAANSLGVSITNNTIKNIGTSTLASYRGLQVFIDDSTNVAGTILIDGNQITNMRRSGIFFDMNNLGSNVNARITNNTVGSTAAPVGQAGQSAMIIFRRRAGGASGNVLVDANTIVNNASGTATSTNTTIFARAEDNANLTVTVTGNTIANLGSTIAEYRADTNFGSPTMCLDMSGNTVDNGSGIIRLHEIAGALNVEQGSAALLASANSLPAANVVTGAGTPNFGVTCAAPPAAPPVAMFDAPPFAAPQRQHVAAHSNDAPALKHTSAARSNSARASFSSSASTQNMTNDMMRRDERASRRSRLSNGTAFRYATSARALTPAVVFSGETLTVNIGTLPAGRSMTIKFQAKINNQVSAGEIVNQGTVSGSNFSSVLTDDPTTAAPNDPTRTPVGTPPTISCPANITVDAAPGAFSASVPFDVTATGVPAPTVECKVGASVITSPHTFPAGTTTVQCKATNGIAPEAACSFTVTVRDVQDPVISCPSNISVSNDANSCAANVNTGTPTVTDNDPSVAISSVRSDGQPLNAPFPSGTTTITWTATDTAGNTDSCQQTVTVADAEAPTIAAPPNVNASTDAGACSANVNPGTPTAGDNCPGVTYAGTRSDGQPLGAAFPIGTTTITWTATDAAGLTASVNQTVTVNDTENPTVVAPADITAGNTAGSCSAIVNPGTATASDNCAGTTVVGTRSDAQGLNDPYPAGTTTITWTATDAAGRTSTDTQTITVNDTEKPSVTSPANVTVSTDAGTCTATVNPGTATATDNCAGVTVAGARSDGQPVNAVYPKGVTTITWTATDAAGNTATSSQTVTVNDTQSPTVNVPADIVQNVDANSCTAIVNFSVTASDNCAGVTFNTSHASGTAFPVGTTVVTANATDAAGNTATKTFTVTVTDAQPPVISCPANIVVSLPLNSAATGVPVTYNPTATDNCAGTTVTNSIPSGSIFPVGTTTVTTTATDAAGNTASCSFTVTVLYNFAGFFSPVENLPVINRVTAGRSVPVKFSLSGDKGLNIFAPGSPASGVIACNSSDPAVDLVETGTAGSSSLTYNAGSDQYTYVWKTEKAWEGTCRQLVIRLADGTERRANFNFK